MLSSSNIRKIAEEAQGEFTLIPLSQAEVEFSPTGLTRLEQVARLTGAPFVYSDYIEDHTPHPLIDWQLGAVRDDFDFGHVVLVNTELLKKIALQMSDDYQAAGWYDLRLRLSLEGRPFHLSEQIYTVLP
ncbi:MAG: hypothetical protein J1E29_07190, partial [Duncaniella sp.]|nr:hypothetical protein [Duncaniella sp.]